MHAESVHRIEAAGFHYKSPESPDIWTHLESHFTGPAHIGPRFGSFSGSRMEAMIAQGEDVLLDAMAEDLERTGKLAPVARMIEMPYIVGTSGILPLADADPAQVMHLIDYPGTASEHIIRIMAVAPDAIPGTRCMTVTGGLYADGHTAGYYDLCPGMPVKCDTCVLLATPEEILSLTREMETKAEDIALVGRRECDEMLARAKRLLG